MLAELVQFLEIPEAAESVDECIIQVNDNYKTYSDIEGDVKNVTRILGHFIVKFIKGLSKKSPIHQDFFDILTKVPKSLKSTEEQSKDYSDWLQTLNYMKFFRWINKINLKPKLTSRKAFQQMFTFSLVDDPSFKSRHFSVVLKRITKHVLLNEFSKHLFMNSINQKNKQNWKNAVKYIAKIPRFLRAMKKPLILNNLTNS